MPFANKYRFTMQIPEAGRPLGEFLVESSEVAHHERGDGTIEYPVTLVLAGPGGRAAVRKTVGERFGRCRTTFSGFGNPYQLHFGRFEVESLGARRYRVTALGTGVRIDLERELRRFLAYARARRKPANDELLTTYIADYRRDVTLRHPELAC